MIEPSPTELDGIERIIKYLEPKNCEIITGQPCGCILSDQCFACIELEAGIDFLRETLARGKKVFGS